MKKWNGEHFEEVPDGIILTESVPHPNQAAIDAAVKIMKEQKDPTFWDKFGEFFKGEGRTD